MPFPFLHVYSGYSFEKSGLKVDQYVERAKKLGCVSTALTDYQTLSGVPAFVHACQKANIKPIIGEDFYFDNLLFTFIVLNEVGYRNLLKLNYESSKGNLKLSVLKEHNDGLVVILPIQNDALKKVYISEPDSLAKKMVKLTTGIKYFFLGIEVNDEINYVNFMREFASNHNYKCVAFPMVKYASKDDAIILKMMESVESKNVLTEKKCSGNEYLLNKETIQKLYTKDEIELANKIANYVKFEFLSNRGKLIQFQNNLNLSSDDYLKKLALDGLKKVNKTSQKYLDRLDYELNVIKKMGYSDYFLIVHDYVSYARKNDISVGPGRGSAAGSLVSYALGITVPDPIEHNLLFERFLNEHRQTMPDIDVDFSDIKREDVVSYIREKYGSERVARIMAIQKIGAKQALNDVGKIFGYEKRDVELFTKMIKEERDDKLSLREIYKSNTDFRALVNDDKYYLEIVSLASKIEGLPRQASLHAVGIVLNADPLETAIPLSSAFDGGYVEQFEKDYNFVKRQYDDTQKVIAELNASISENKKQLENKITENEDDLKELYKNYESKKIELNEKLQSVRTQLSVYKSIKENIDTKFSDIEDIKKELNYKKELSDTVNGSISGKEKIKLETYIQMTYFDRIIARANTRFMIMSNGQYELKRRNNANSISGQSGLDLDIIDHYNGSTRSVKTLSGGESFKASLSLALGLTDEIPSSAGGIKLDTMFVDEGFGSLDEDSLRQALKALNDLTEGNKLVGIISHVAELKEKIDKQIVVTKDREGGSKVEIVV